MKVVESPLLKIKVPVILILFMAVLFMGWLVFRWSMPATMFLIANPRTIVGPLCSSTVIFIITLLIILFLIFAEKKEV